MIPGNHDVDRDVVKKSSTIQDRHEKLRASGKQTELLEKELLRLYEDEEAFLAIQKPLAAYSKFAGQYDCVPGKNVLFWEDSIPLNDGSTLKIRGCNSAIVSDDLDDEGLNRLVVGEKQMLPPAEDGVTYLLMCHHPVDWLHDRDAVKDCLKARVPLALFGHKHVQRLESLGERLHIAAGAVHPDRNGGTWEPRYNFLGMSVSTDGETRTLDVSVWPRKWDIENRKFVADFDEHGAKVRNYRLPLPAWTPVHSATVEPLAGSGPRTTVTEGGIVVNPKRQLVFRFHSLPYLRRLEVVAKLKLARDTDEDLREDERYPLYFKRAEEMGILDEFWTCIEQQLGVDISDNPFKKSM